MNQGGICMMTVKEVCGLTGVTVRTLHFYDKIGLLKPACVTQAGYRMYGDDELQRLQQILFFRELDFSLDEIKRILDSPDYDRNEAMIQQETLLTLRCKRLNSLIQLIRDIREKETSVMSFKEFDASEIDAYAQEAKERWQDTAAYKECEQKTAGNTKEDWGRLNRGLIQCFEGFANIKNESPDSASAREQVEKLREYISANFYNCTVEILQSLGEMYCADERFRKNIDKCGEGTAEFASKAIAAYCR